MPDRKTGLDVSVFTLGGTTYIDDLQDAEIIGETKDAEGKGINDRHDFPVAVGTSGRIEGNIMVASVAALMGTVLTGTAVVTISVNTGANTYGGNALLSSVGHRIERDGLQMQRVSLKFQGTPTVTAPS
jgi:hypothetical protein